MKREQAETLAIDALAWLADDQERLGHFLNASGAAVEDLRTRAQEPEFLGFILDFLMLDDENILAFSQFSNQQPNAVEQARHALTGEYPNWT